MPVHDWTTVDAGIFHDFHTVWTGALRTALNGGLLPSGYYALAEQHTGHTITDVLTLHTGPVSQEPPPLPPATGGTAVAEVPPRVHLRQTVLPAALGRRRSLAIRHVSGHRLVALLEIVSPANKDRTQHLEEFAAKAVSALHAGVHLLVVDLFPPGIHDPHGMRGLIRQWLEQSDEPYDLPGDRPLTLVSYAAEPQPAGAERDLSVEVFLSHVAVGAALPEMPLFVLPGRYVDVPLESTYQAASVGMPSFWRDVLEGRQPAP